MSEITPEQLRDIHLSYGTDPKIRHLVSDLLVTRAERNILRDEVQRLTENLSLEARIALAETHA